MTKNQALALKPGNRVRGADPFNSATWKKDYYVCRIVAKRSRSPIVVLDGGLTIYAEWLEVIRK